MPRKPAKPPLADETTAHVDFFSDGHTNRMPVILSDGTSIKWPRGWTEKQADEFRRTSHLMRPSRPDNP
jgi:hypothetical protein